MNLTDRIIRDVYRNAFNIGGYTVIHSVTTPEPIRWTHHDILDGWSPDDPIKFKATWRKPMGIEKKFEGKIRGIHNRLDWVASRGLYPGGLNSKKINPVINEVLLALLDHLGLEPILTPDTKVELREKKEEK